MSSTPFHPTEHNASISALFVLASALVKASFGLCMSAFSHLRTDVPVFAWGAGLKCKSQAAAASRHAAKRQRTPSGAQAPAHALLGGPNNNSRAAKRRRTLQGLAQGQQPEDAPACAEAAVGAAADKTPVGPADPTCCDGENQGQVPNGAAAAGRSMVLADSVEVGSCVADDVLDDVSSADAEHHQHYTAAQQQQQQQQRGHRVSQQGRAVVGAAHSAGKGQWLSGDLLWKGPSIEPPTELGLHPLEHQTYYKGFTRVCLRV